MISARLDALGAIIYPTRSTTDHGRPLLADLISRVGKGRTPLQAERLWCHCTPYFIFRMPKTRAEKEAVVQDLTEKLGRMRSMVFANYEGLTVKEVEELRRELAKAGVTYSVAKKTLLARAMELAGTSIDPRTIAGNFGTAIAFEDEVAPARIMATFAKQHEALRMVAGVLEGKLLDKAAVVALAKLPSKQELIGKAVGSIAAPLSGFVRVLAGNLRGLVYTLQAIKESKS